tara:strand:- start:1 stop:432 length:432 start_codon:yes stop_codon:yes gene_type:complete
VVDLGIDSCHKDDGFIGASDVFGGVAQRVSSTELLEADERGEFRAKAEEEIGFRFETVVRAVVDDGGQVASSLEDGTKVITLRRIGIAAGQHTGNDHQSISADRAGMISMISCKAGILSTGSNNNSDSCLDETANALLSLTIG